MRTTKSSKKKDNFWEQVINANGLRCVCLMRPTNPTWHWLKASHERQKNILVIPLHRAASLHVVSLVLCQQCRYYLSLYPGYQWPGQKWGFSGTSLVLLNLQSGKCQKAQPPTNTTTADYYSVSTTRTLPHCWLAGLRSWDSLVCLLSDVFSGLFFFLFISYTERSTTTEVVSATLSIQHNTTANNIE